MKKKKWASLFLAIAMAFAMAIPAFAGESTGSGGTVAPANTVTSNVQTTDFTGEAAMYTVKLTIAPTGKLIVNPYGIAAKVDGFEDSVKDQVITAATFITNHTDVALKASAKITVTPTANIVLLDEQGKVNTASAKAYLGTYTKGAQENGSEDDWAPNANATDSTKVEPTSYVPKGVFLAFEMINAKDNESQPTSWKAATAIPGNTADGASGASKGSTIILKDGENTLNDCLKLAAVGAEDDDNYAAFHFTGLANPYPKKPNGTQADPEKTVAQNTVTDNANAKTYATDFEDDPWTAADKISASVVLTFTPDVAVTTYTTPTASAASGA